MNEIFSVIIILSFVKDITQSPFTSISAVCDVMADYISLFAVFKSGEFVYNNLCGCLC